MPKILLDVPLHQQQSDGDCLAACTVMVLAYLGQDMKYAQVANHLGIRSYGAPAGNIRRLSQWDLDVVYSQTDVAGLEAMVQHSHPVIVFVRTGELPYWPHDSAHALLVVGYDAFNIYVNDPYFAEAPIAVPRGDFELAWLERDYFYALVTTMRE